MTALFACGTGSPHVPMKNKKPSSPRGGRVASTFIPMRVLSSKYTASRFLLRFDFFSSREEAIRSAVLGKRNASFFRDVEPTHHAIGLHAGQGKSTRYFVAAPSRFSNPSTKNFSIY